MRAVAWSLLTLLLAGCASDPGLAPGWSFTARDDDGAARDITGAQEAFDAAILLEAPAGARQLGGAWVGPLDKDVPFTLSFNASVPLRVAFHVRDASGATASGTCNWPEDSTEMKPVSIGSAGMRSTDTTCEIRFVPSIDVQAGASAPLRWEARTSTLEESPWRLAFSAARET